MTLIPNIRDASWLKNAATQRVFSLLGEAGFRGRVVGGAVRNTLLGQPISDIDFAVTALPEEVMALANSAGIKCLPTGLKHGTVTLMIDGEIFELTTLRCDVQTDGRHAVVAFTNDWAKDAARRDFTINALYVGNNGGVYDPLNGYLDLLRCRIAFIGKADARISEDYLRILRFFRFFAQYGEGVIDPSGFQACIRGGGGLAQISGERIRVELLKMLVAPNAIDAVRALYESGLFLRIFRQVPCLNRFYHMAKIENILGLEPDGLMRLGALFVHIPEDIITLDQRLRLSKKEKQKLNWFIAWQGFSFSDHGALAESLYYKGKKAVYYALLGAMLEQKEKEGLRVDAIKVVLRQITQWQQPDFPLKGQDLIQMGQVPGKALGAQLKALEHRWVKSMFLLPKETLLDSI